MSSSDSVSHLEQLASEHPMVVVSLARTLYALPVMNVREMVSTPEVRSIPHPPPGVRGLINLRASVLPLFDLRSCFGMATQRDESLAFVAMLEQRKQDHKRWLDELAASVREGRAFTLTTDPHACAFGRWYDTYKTDNLMLDTVLRRFDEPHKRVHALGADVVGLVEAGKQAEALAQIDIARNGVLSQMMTLFDAAEEIIGAANREISVVVSNAGKSCAVAVDAIESVERLSRDGVTGMDEAMAGQRVQSILGVGRRTKDNAFVLILDPAMFLGAA
jgi:chemotaxis signal transduction protein